MIVPILKGLVNFSRAPVTWTILILNIIMLFISQVEVKNTNTLVNDIFENNDLVKIQATNFSQFVLDQPSHYPKLTLDLAHKINLGDYDKVNIVASIAIADYHFNKEYLTYNFIGDQIGISLWKNKFKNVINSRNNNVNYRLGVNKTSYNFLTPITYQFIHSDFTHLFSNSIFLLIFGAALEAQIGSFVFLIMYLMLGYISALFFVLFSSLSLAPLVGASGAIAGIMAFYCFSNINMPVRFFWMVGFNKGYYGQVYLPAWVAFVMWFVSDLAGYIGSIEAISGVAFLAHLGGELSGVVCALALILINNLRRPFFWSKSTS